MPVLVAWFDASSARVPGWPRQRTSARSSPVDAGFLRRSGRPSPLLLIKRQCLPEPCPSGHRTPVIRRPSSRPAFILVGGTTGWDGGASTWTMPGPRPGPRMSPTTPTPLPLWLAPGRIAAPSHLSRPATSTPSTAPATTASDPPGPPKARLSSSSPPTSPPSQATATAPSPPGASPSPATSSRTAAAVTPDQRGHPRPQKTTLPRADAGRRRSRRRPAPLRPRAPRSAPRRPAPRPRAARCGPHRCDSCRRARSQSRR